MRNANATGTREFLIICDKGDELPGALLDFARRHAVGAASFHAIGAFRDATIAYWNAETKKYEEIPVQEQVEVLSMMGNILPSSEDLKLHAHTTLGKRDGSTIGGHFVRGVVFPTLEIFLSECVTNVQRKKDPETGLWLLQE
jgi:predicted DNA-binding protein with PD1-like motif